MYVSEDLTGRVFGRLTVLERADDETILSYGKKLEDRPFWLCKCEYGNIHLTNAHSLTHGTCRSCGCLARDVASITGSTHKMHESKLYAVYCAMKDRCYNPNNKRYADYGGRGIRICEEWYNPNLSDIDLRNAGNPGFVAFMEWSYSHGYFDFDDSLPWNDRPSIDRIDVDGPYAPWNCRYITIKEQINNRRNTRCIIDFDGKPIPFEIANGKYKLRPRQIVSWDNGHWSNDEMLYAIEHPEVKLHRKTGSGMLVDNDNMIHLIPRYTDAPDRQVDSNANRRTRYLKDFDNSDISYADFERKYGLNSSSVANMFKSDYTNDMILYVATHKDQNLRKSNKSGMLVDEEGFIQLIPRYTDTPDK